MNVFTEMFSKVSYLKVEATVEATSVRLYVFTIHPAFPCRCVFLQIYNIYVIQLRNSIPT